jgi:hypothetical protein
MGPRAGLQKCGKFRPPPGFDHNSIDNDDCGGGGGDDSNNDDDNNNNNNNKYAFGIINWKIKDKKKIDRITRKILTMYKVHYPKADRQAICKEERRRERSGACRNSI